MAVLGTALRWVVGVGLACTFTFELAAVLTSEVCTIRTSEQWIEPGTLADRCAVTAICDGDTLREGTAWMSTRRRGVSPGSSRCAYVDATMRYYPMMFRFREDGPIAGWTWTLVAAVVAGLGFAAARQLDPPEPTRISAPR